MRRRRLPPATTVSALIEAKIGARGMLHAGNVARAEGIDRWPAEIGIRIEQESSADQAPALASRNGRTTRSIPPTMVVLPSPTTSCSFGTTIRLSSSMPKAEPVWMRLCRF